MHYNKLTFLCYISCITIFGSAPKLKTAAEIPPRQKPKAFRAAHYPTQQPTTENYFSSKKAADIPPRRANVSSYLVEDHSSQAFKPKPQKHRSANAKQELAALADYLTSPIDTTAAVKTGQLRNGKSRT